MKPSFPQPFDMADGRRLSIQVAQQDDIEDIYSFLIEHFFSRPPVLQLCKYDSSMTETQKEEWIRGHINHCTSLPISLVVRDMDGQLVAVRLNVIEERPPDGVTAKEELNLCTAFKSQLNRGVDLYKVLETDRILHMAMVAVSSDYGQVGLGTRLYQLSMEIGVSNGVGGIKTEAASVYVAKLVTKLGFETFNTLDYAQLELNGSRPLVGVDMGEHQIGRLMARRL